MTERTMNEMREVKELAIGDVIQVEGFDDNLTVRSAKKIKKGLDAGKLQVTLVTPDDETEVMGFAPEERVKVVGKDTEGGKGKGGGKGRGKGKAKGKAKAKPEAETAPAPEAEAPKTDAPKKPRRQKKAEGARKLSALDAAAKVLTETGQAMNCQELIKAMAEKGYWTSPGGKTPAATLYSAMLRETQTKGKDSRFRKTERGKFEATNSK
jgi:HB1/ASXL restriction endonuclease-like protein with HTH domain